MDSEKIMKLFDTCWFEMEILKKQSSLSTCSKVEANRDRRNEEKPLKAEFLQIPTPFTFELVLNYNRADIQISFRSRDHGMAILLTVQEI
ncbi:hypothetical protein CICLE_v10030430mg [Citrus x clementina]|uniref:Uncharacterized protein n=1 Tax=Citrus clementina TaxID=85681 RepID=V4SH35_CITCL|nr:hypothetical protein CICLE_v10030430mg [Citrus x clementina]